MEILIFCLAAFLVILGIIGSILPVLPGVPLSWAGLLVLYFIPGLPTDYWFLGITLIIAALIYILNLFIPAMGTKRYGGSRKGMIGATLGLVIGLLTPIPFGIIIGTFLGAFIGEIINRSDSKSAVKAAFGSFVGLLASSFMEFLVAFAFLLLFVYKAWEYHLIIF
ncbi:DUF456 domain-containing protein [Salegentibacter chungangensis]|uniref:DUF456 domain-containing protein n=1 Tax=Salegentibacter chungangensis TaxID=1335724 RepID=A0ABW3NPL6_9FLAO